MKASFDASVEDILHRVYDPVKAREYYLRTRDLKGRRKAAVEPTNGPRESASQLEVVKPRGSKTTPAERRKNSEARVAALKEKLSRLESMLAELVEQAKARSGIETKAEKKADKKPTSTKDSPKEKLTAKEKKEAAERSRKSYEKNKKAAEPDAAALEAKIADVRAKIQEMREDLIRVRAKSADRPRGKGRGRSESQSSLVRPTSLNPSSSGSTSTTAVRSR